MGDQPAERESEESTSAPRGTRRFSWEMLFAGVASVAAAIAAYVAFSQSLQTESQTAVSLAQSRPFLDVQIRAPLPKDLSIIVLAARNRGPIAARLLSKQYVSWNSAQPRYEPQLQQKSLVLYPDGEANLMRWTFEEGAPAAILDGRVSLHLGMCVLYESADQRDPRRWVVASWLKYSPKTHTLSVEKLDDLEVETTQADCSVDSGRPEGWGPTV